MAEKSPPTSLGRPATGLPRYYMDVGWYRHPRFTGLAPDVLFVFEAAVGYCYEHATSGELPRGSEDLSLNLGVKMSAVKRAVTALIERGAFEDRGCSLHIRNFEEHNPTGEEIQARTSERSSAGAYGNHVRWHEKKGVTDADCEFCDA